MPTLLTPGVYYEVADRAQARIAGLRTDIAALLGLAERGPAHAPTRVNSWEQFQTRFGNFIPGGYLAYAAKAFFVNGGASLDIGRIVARAPGAALAGAGDLLDGGGTPTLHIEASSPGGWGNAVTVHVSHAHPAATRTRFTTTLPPAPIPQPADRRGLFVESVSGFEVGALARVVQQTPAAVQAYHIVRRVDPALRFIQWEEPLEAGFVLNQPFFIETLEFGLAVYERGIPRALYAGLSLNPAHPRYVEAVVNADAAGLIRVHDLGADPTFLTNIPALTAPNLTRGWLLLAGGKDGLAALTPLDFTGDPGVEEKWGVRTLEDVDEVAIVAAPDILIQPAPAPVYAHPEPPPVDPCLPCQPALPPAPQPPPIVPEQPPTFSLDDVFRVQAALVAHCETLADRFAVLDPPFSTANGVEADLGEIMSWRLRFDTKYAALYYPWLRVPDPLELGGAVVRAVPPSGHVVGVYANTDRTVGVWKAPANVALSWAQDVTVAVSAAVQGLLNPRGINALRVFPGRGLRVYGARTLSSDPDWVFVNVRRLMLMVEKAVYHSIQWAVFEPNDVYLREKLRVAIGSFLTELWRRGGLTGARPEDAYFVKCDAQNNPPDQAARGELLVEVGVAPARPAEFVVFRIGRTDNTLELME